MGSTEVVLISILISTFPFCFCGSDCGCCLLGSVTLAPLTEPPLDHVFVNLADHVGVHMDDVVVLTENFEGLAGEHQFNEQLRVPDGEVKFHEFVAWFAANPDIDRKSTRLNSSHVRISYAVF